QPGQWCPETDALSFGAPENAHRECARQSARLQPHALTVERIARVPFGRSEVDFGKPPHWGKAMKRVTVFAFAIAGIAIGAGLVGAQTRAPAGEPELRQPASKEWLHVGGDWSNSRYSTLTQITPANVKDLKGAWVVHLGSGLGSKYSLEATPLVKDGVMYVTSGNDDVFALDAKTGALIWEHKSGLDQNINTVCCGWDNRGLAIGDGRVYLGRLDGT